MLNRRRSGGRRQGTGSTAWWLAFLRRHLLTVFPRCVLAFLRRHLLTHALFLHESEKYFFLELVVLQKKRPPQLPHRRGAKSSRVAFCHSASSSTSARRLGTHDWRTGSLRSSIGIRAG